jgi:asparagine synthase (glutamine-hydrolysing)
MGAVWGFTGPPNRQLADNMAATLSHRGCQQIESANDPNGTLELRHPHRPWCLGLVPPALHRFGSENLTIALCGWINAIDDSELAAAASKSSDKSRRHFYKALALRMRSDGPAAVRLLRGAFILAVKDGSTLHVARDGAGNRTAFYGLCKDRWLFAVEPKAITAMPGFEKRIRPVAIAQYLACSFVPGRCTMLDNIYEVQAGSTVTLREGQTPQTHRWFRFEENEPSFSEEMPTELDSSREDTEAAQVASFRTEMERAVAERIPRNEPVGVFLSGGLDSSVVTAELARQIGGKNIRTWAIHFGKKYHHELDFARAVAERCGTVHEEVLIEPKQFLPSLRRMIWHLDEPIGEPITQPNYELASRVSRDVRFVFNGEGGDPCFGGPKNIPMMLHHWYGGLDRSENFRERHYLQSYRRAWEEIDFLLSDEVRSQIDVERDLDGVFAPYLRTDRPRLFLNRLTAINIREKGAHLIQPKVERMLGAHGLTPLAPLFDERIVRLSFQIPAQMKLHGGVEKVILKRAYENDLPPEVINRPKSGMRVPVHYWFQSEMRRYARRILSPRAVRDVGLFNPDRVKQLQAYDIEEGRGRYGLRLWMLITFELWRRIVVEGEPV